MSNGAPRLRPQPGSGRSGRPRSQQARQAVLHAVDDMLVEVGYGAMTMKGIAERAGVGRQTVYRWWSTKAEILLEACIDDAPEELGTVPHPDPAEDLLRYLLALSAFLTTSPAGLSYRALIGEAQHDPAVRRLMQDNELLTASAVVVLERNRRCLPRLPERQLAAVQLTGPVLHRALLAPKPFPRAALRTHVHDLLAAWGADVSTG